MRVTLLLVAGITVVGCKADKPSRGHSEAAPITLAMRVGCADGEREGFVDISTHPRIAGCAGAWSIPGILEHNPGEPAECPGVKTHDTTHWSCGGTGDDLDRVIGEGCNVSDLCAPGWHVCTGALDVAVNSRDGCRSAAKPTDPPMFFAVRQSSTGCAQCASGDRVDSACRSNTCSPGCRQTALIANDIFGCGNLGFGVSTPTCQPLDRFSNDKCVGFSNTPWSCDLPGPEDDRGVCEAYTVSKRGPSHGGVLCCKDPDGSPSPPNPFDCSAARAVPARISPADGTMRSIAIDGVAPASPGEKISFRIVSIRQDEPIEGEHHAGDARGIGEAVAYVRAKSSPGNGRVYHVEFRANSVLGGACVGNVTVCVPSSNGSECKDDAPLFDATEER